MYPCQSGTHLDAPRFRWKKGRVPYQLHRVYRNDKNLIRTAMDKIESNTCLRFIDKTGEKLGGRYLKIWVSSRSCIVEDHPRFSAKVCNK